MDEPQITKSMDTFKGLSNLVLYSLPESLLTPLLNKLQLDYSAEESACKWLKYSDPALRNVVCKEALQWRKNGNAQVVKFHTTYLIIAWVFIRIEIIIYYN